MSAPAWLLDPRVPSVRLVALRDLERRATDDPEVIAARDAIPVSRWAKKIVSGQMRAGTWVSDGNAYQPKFTGTVWRLQALAEIEMPGEVDGVRRACDRFLELNVMAGSGFTCGGPSNRRRFPEECVTGHMMWTLQRLGRGDEPAVRAAMEWLLAVQLPDGGWNCDRRAGVRHSSLLSTLAGLKALAGVQRRHRTRPQREAVERGVEFLLAHRLWRSHRDGAPVRKFWPPRIAFPAHYSYDLLQPLRVLAMLGTPPDDRLREGLDLLAARADRHRRWPVERIPVPANGDDRFRLRIEPQGRPSRWVTAHAMLVLRHFGRRFPNGDEKGTFRTKSSGEAQPQ